MFGKFARFRDTQGHKWRLVIDAAAVERCKLLTGLDLSHTGTPLVEIGKDKSGQTLIDTLYAILHPDVEAAGLTRDEFIWRVRPGRIIDPAATALCEAAGKYWKSRGQIPYIPTISR